MSASRVNFAVNNNLGTPAIWASSLATRPQPGYIGRVFIDTDIPSTGIYRDNGTNWINVSGGGGATQNLQSVCNIGSTTTTSMSIGPTPAGAIQKLIVNSVDTFVSFPNSIVQTFLAQKDQTFNAGSVLITGPAYVAGCTSANYNIAAALNIPNGVSNFGSFYGATSFTLNGQIVSQGQAAGLRCISEIKSMKAFNGAFGSGGQISHSAGLWSYGLYSPTANPQVLNHFGVLISNQTEVYAGTVNNRYGLYQEGPLDNNWFAAKVTIGGGGPGFTGDQFLVQGTAQISSGYLQITGTGTTSTTFGLNVMNNGGTTGLRVLDNGNVGIRTASPTARLHIATGGASTAALGLKVRNSADTIDVLSTFGTTQVIINSTSAALNNSAQLQIDSTDRGVLLPRMTTAQILAIATPADGLLVFNTTLSVLCCYQAGVWVKFSHSPM